MIVLADQRQPVSQRPLRLGFLGLGWIGRARLASLLQHMQHLDVSLFDVDASACGEALAHAPRATICSGEDELLDRPLDGIVIATPNMLHEAQCLAAIERSVAVFCQKPLAPNAAAAQRILEAARTHDVLLEVDWSYRHLRGVQTTRRLLRDNELGEVVAIDLTFHNAWGPDGAWFYDRKLAGGGCLVDLGVHLIDLALHLLGPDTALTCSASHVAVNGRPLVDTVDGPVEDFAFAMLNAERGPAVRLACSWRTHLGRDCAIEIDVHGTRGGVSIHNIDGSFFNFETRLHTSTKSERLSLEHGTWGGGALTEWARRVRHGDRFDPAVERAVQVATLVETIYVRAAGAPLEAMSS